MFLYKHFVKGAALGELDDVCRNLSNVLRSKRGTGYFRRNFGLTEAGYRTPEEMIVGLTAELKENIHFFEPRVELIGIDEDYDDDGGRARLIVKLRLRGAKERLRVEVDLRSNTIAIVPVETPAKAK